jgi:hypothetical protein
MQLGKGLGLLEFDPQFAVLLDEVVVIETAVLVHLNLS